MSLYHEAASVLGADLSAAIGAGGNLRSRVFDRKDLKSPPSQVYALALETCKWSSVLSEVIDNSQLLRHEKKLTPMLALLLVHDFLLKRGGIALPASHGLRATVERQKASLTAEFTRARIRKKCSSVDALREHIEASLYANCQHPRWVRINTLKSTLEDQLSSTFAGYQTVDSVQKVLRGAGKLVYVDEHIPNLVAVSPRFEFARCDAYRSGAIILQDKASCFPAYLLDLQPGDGHVIDGCAAPGNKTTHLAAIIKSGTQAGSMLDVRIHAFEKDPVRAKTLEKMVKVAGSDGFTHVHQGQDFLKVNPLDEDFGKVGAVLLDPSCSGSGIVGRDDMPELHLPTTQGANVPAKSSKKAAVSASRKRKRQEDDAGNEKVLIDDDGNKTVATSKKDLDARLEALSSFQLSILLHAFSFPAARKITYSTCSVHAEENEHVVLKSLQSDTARQYGWRILPREAQVNGMKTWPVRGLGEACSQHSEVAEACIRAYKDDGRGVMGFFVAAFVRDEDHGASPSVGRSGHKKTKVQCVSKKKNSPQQNGTVVDEFTATLPKAGTASTGADADGIEDGSDDSDWNGFDG